MSMKSTGARATFSRYGRWKPARVLAVLDCPIRIASMSSWGSSAAS